MYLAKKKSLVVLLDLAFVDDKTWTGGKARSVQLFEIFETSGFNIIDLKPIKRPKFITVILYALRYGLLFRYYRPFGVSSFREAGICFYTYKKLFSEIPEISHVVREGTGFGALVCAPIIKRMGRRIFFIPANIEGMAPYNNAWTHQITLSKRLHEEFHYFRFADAVFCISEEETWLLRIAGVNAHFLPYVPPKELMQKIEIRKNNRNPDENFGLLYFANFHNEPNILGFKKLMTSISTKRIQLPYKLKVAGLGSEKMKAFTDNINGVDFIGEQSLEQMEDCLNKCMGVVLFHHPTSGMLTRVPEMIFSGIPIYGNEDALKSYGVFWGYNTVFKIDVTSANSLFDSYKNLECHFLKELNF